MQIIQIGALLRNSNWQKWVQEPVLALPAPDQGATPPAEEEVPPGGSALPVSKELGNSESEEEEFTESDLHMQQAIEMSMTGETPGLTLEEEILGLQPKRPQNRSLMVWKRLFSTLLNAAFLPYP